MHFLEKKSVMSVGEFNTQQKVLKEGRQVLPHINSFTNAPLANI